MLRYLYHMRQQPLHLAGAFITFLGAVMFSTKAIMVKLAFSGTGVDAVSLLTLRMAFSLPFYLVIAWYVSKGPAVTSMNRRQWLWVFLLGIIGYYLSSLFDFIGLQYISAALERLILFLYPTFAIIINRVLFRQQVYRNQWIALALTYAGIAIAFMGEVKTGGDNFWLGSFFVLLCALTFGIYIAGSGRLIPQVGSNRFTAYAMLSSSFGVFVHYLMADGSFQFMDDRSVLGFGLLLALVATVVPSFLIAHGMKRIGANNVAIISSIGPVSTILQAHFILDEPIYGEQLAGTMLVVVGILMLGSRR